MMKESTFGRWYDDLSDPEPEPERNMSSHQPRGTYVPPAFAPTSSVGNYRTTMQKEEQERRERKRRAELEASAANSKTKQSSGRSSKRSSSPSLLDERRPRKNRRTDKIAGQRSSSPSLLDNMPFYGNPVADATNNRQDAVEITTGDDDDDIMVLRELPPPTRCIQKNACNDTSGFPPQKKEAKFTDASQETGDETPSAPRVAVVSTSSKPKRQAPPPPVISGITIKDLKEKADQDGISGSNELGKKNFNIPASESANVQGKTVQGRNESESLGNASHATSGNDGDVAVDANPSEQSSNAAEGSEGPKKRDKKQPLYVTVKDYKYVMDVLRNEEVEDRAENFSELPPIANFAKGMSQPSGRGTGRSERLSNLVDSVRNTKLAQQQKSTNDQSAQDPRQGPSNSQRESRPEEVIDLVSDEEQ